MEPFVKFLRYNNLKQKDLAGYLGVTEASISRMINGTLPISAEYMRKILNNDKGWDTSMLSGNTSITAHATRNSSASVSISGAGEQAGLKKEIEMLREELRRKDEQISKLINLLCDRQ